MKRTSQIYRDISEKLSRGEKIPTINKNGVELRRLTVFEEVIFRNLNNTETPALEINGNSLTYGEFFFEVEEYITSFCRLGIKQGDVVSFCMPVSVEYICAYFALTTIGVVCNLLNVTFLLSQGAQAYLDKRCSETLICYDKYFNMLMKNDSFRDSAVKTVILTGDETYAHIVSDAVMVHTPQRGLAGMNILTFQDFLVHSTAGDVITAVPYNEECISTLCYTSGTTGPAKCMGHSALAPLFLINAHDHTTLSEHKGDRTLLTIPLQHSTGLFYSACLQLAKGKTLVLEPIYDKRLFAKDIKKWKINHAVQAKPFYAQLIQDRADGVIHQHDFELLRHPISGGENIPLAVCRKINEVLAYAGCKMQLMLGYGRSEEGSETIAPYNMKNMEGRENTVGASLFGTKAKLVDLQTMHEITLKPNVKGEILISTPITPVGHCYLNAYNNKGMSDGSVVDKNGVRWARTGDIAKYVTLTNGENAFIILGRANDSIKKGEKIHYLFELKEQISDLEGIQECEVLATESMGKKLITVHCVRDARSGTDEEKLARNIYAAAPMIDGIKFYTSFNLNATSGKCDRAAMRKEKSNFYVLKNGEIKRTDFA